MSNTHNGHTQTHRNSCCPPHAASSLSTVEGLGGLESRHGTTSPQKLLSAALWLRGEVSWECLEAHPVHDLYPAKGATYLSRQLVVTSGTCTSPELLVAIRELAVFCVSPSTQPGFQESTAIAVLSPECPVGLGHCFGCPSPTRETATETQCHCVG